MIAKLIELSVRNKLLVLLVTIALVGAGVWATVNSSIDAIPDLSDVQVIVITDFPGQAPQVVEDQVTYPLTTALAGVGAKVVRGFSMFETSMVYVIFPDGTRLRDARERVLEYLNYAKARLPAGVEPKLGPDATGVGWVYQYVLYPGYYDLDHPEGIWNDSDEGKWYAEPSEAPVERREKLVKVRGFDKPGPSRLTGKPLGSSNQDAASLRSLQDWYLRFPLTSVNGVAEVASIGGFVKEYQIVLKPEKLLAYHLAVKDLVTAVQRSNNDVGGSVIEMSENEYMVRSRGYLHGLGDLAQVPVGTAQSPELASAHMIGTHAENGNQGVPVFLKDVATLQIAGEERRGVGEWNGQGEAVSGIVISRYGANAYQVIKDAKAKLAELEGGLPPGVMIKTAYDRSDLIDRSIHTLRHTLIEEMIVVSLVCVFFLLHARSALVAIFVIPGSMLISLLTMNLLGINANIMSLGGIAIAIGVVVDSAIIMIENAHKHLNQDEERVAGGAEPRPHAELILEAAKEVGPSLFFSLLIITVSFLPVFALGGESGRLFRPLAFTKTFAMAAAAVLSVTIIPVLMTYFIRPRALPKSWNGRTQWIIIVAAVFLPALALYFAPHLLAETKPYRWWMVIGWMVMAAMVLLPQKITHEETNPISRGLQNLYEPFFHGAIRFRWAVLVLAALVVASAIWPFRQLGNEFMPPLDEGDLLYMPTTDPSISVTKARQVLQQTDKLIKTFPEVVSVYGKAGRAESATDPAPMNMVETVVRLNTDPAAWRTRKVHHWFDAAPHWVTWPLHRTFWPERQRLTMNELVQGWDDADGHHAGMDQVVRFPGLGNLWPMPIDNRLKMLSTGIKSPVGLKISGPDLQTLARLAERAAAILRQMPGTSDAYPERAFGGNYLDINVNRSAAARYGLTTGDVQDVISTAVGGMRISTAVEGLERYPINLRYARDLRDDPTSLKQVLVPTPSGAQIPLGEVTNIKINSGPPMILSEGGRPEALVFVVPSHDVGSYVEQARQVIAQKLPLPAGYNLSWSGEFEQIQETNARLKWAVPLTLSIIAMLLYLATASVFRVAVILLAVPFSLVGAVWLLWLLGYHLSGAVWVGMIALAGLDAETGLVMLLYLDNSYERFKAQGKMNSSEDLLHAVHDGAVKRIRPKTMTVAAAFIGLAPLLWSNGTGADVMRRLAAPMLGGLFTSFLMELLIYPVIFFLAKSVSMRRRPAGGHSSGNWRAVTAVIAGMVMILGAGCTVHPEGEASERAASKSAGAAFSKRFEAREISRLSANPSVDELVNYALLSNAQVEQRYWEWRSAIEQVTQDGTQPTNLSISASSMISNGRLSWDRTSVTVGNDPMADIVWPRKLSIAAQRSLENARAAGIRFQKARYELRGKVLAGYDEFALTAELLRIEESSTALLAATAAAVEARNQAGSARLLDVLKAQNDFDLSRNDAAMLRSQLSAQRTALNALLGRGPGAGLAAPDTLPPIRAMAFTDDQILELAARRNPELQALAAELRGKEDGIRLARLGYLPDFSLSVGTDLAGISQTLLGALTAPLLRFESINAAIAQAEANLRAAESMRRQITNDLAAQVVSDLLGVRDADRQLGLLNDSILPRARQVVMLSRSSYESGQASLLELLDSQRSLLAIERLEANLQITRDKRLSELETVTANSLCAGPTPGTN